MRLHLTCKCGAAWCGDVHPYKRGTFIRRWAEFHTAHGCEPAGNAGETRVPVKFRREKPKAVRDQTKALAAARARRTWLGVS